MFYPTNTTYNPVDANMTNKVGEYEYTLFHNIINNKNYIYSSRQSIILQDFTINDLISFMDIKLSEYDLMKIYEKQKVITNKIDFKTKINNKQSLMFYFKNSITKKERNIAIKNAYNANYSQVEISNYTKLSESSISKIVNS